MQQMDRSGIRNPRGKCLSECLQFAEQKRAVKDKLCCLPYLTPKPFEIYPQQLIIPLTGQDDSQLLMPSQSSRSK